MKNTKSLSIILAAVMLCTMLTGCMGGKTIIKISGSPVSEEIYTAALSYVDAINFQQQYGFSMADMLDQQLDDGKTGADMLKEETDAFFAQYEAIWAFAKENGIKLDSEDAKERKTSKDAQIESAGSRKAFLDGLAESGMNEAFFDYIIKSQQLMSKVYSAMFAGDGEFAPTKEEVLASLEGFVRVKHILIMAEEGAEDYAEKKAKAEDIASRIKAGEDFEALLSENGEDPGMQSYPGGYIIDADGYTIDGSGQMIAEFTAASHALAVNGVSDIVPSQFGFHIIKRYAFDEAYISENLASYSGVAGTNNFAMKLSEFAQTLEVEKTKAYDEVDVHAVFGKEKPLGAGTATTEHSEDDGHNHEAEGGIEEGTAVPAE